MATLTPDRLWKLTQQHLKSVLGAEKYTAYLETAVLIEQQDDLWRIGVRDEEARAWLSNGSYTAVANALSSIVGQPVRLEFFDLDLPPLARKQPKDDGRPSTPEAAWKATLGELELQMSRSTFQSWLADAVLLRVEDGRFVLGVRNEDAVDWLESRLKDTIARTLMAIYGQPVELVFTVGEGVSKANGRGPEPPPNWEEPAAPKATAQWQQPPPKRKKKPAANPDTGVEIKTASPTNPLKGHIEVSHYAIRFYQPLLGRDAFDLWMIISSYAFEFNVLKKKPPTLKKLAAKLGYSHISPLVGRAQNPPQYGLLNILRDYRICNHKIIGHGRGQRQLFDNLKEVDHAPLLTRKQVERLSKEDQEEHMAWLVLHSVSIDAWLEDDRESLIEAGWPLTDEDADAEEDAGESS